MMNAFKIQWTDTKDYTLTTYRTVADAIDFGKTVSNDFRVVDAKTGELMSHYIDHGYSDHDFVNVGGMNYRQVRRMCRE